MRRLLNDAGELQDGYTLLPRWRKFNRLNVRRSQLAPAVLLWSAICGGHRVASVRTLKTGADQAAVSALAEAGCGWDLAGP